MAKTQKLWSGEITMHLMPFQALLGFVLNRIGFPSLKWKVRKSFLRKKYSRSRLPACKWLTCHHNLGKSIRLTRSSEMWHLALTKTSSTLWNLPKTGQSCFLHLAFTWALYTMCTKWEQEQIHWDQTKYLDRQTRPKFRIAVGFAVLHVNQIF